MQKIFFGLSFSAGILLFISCNTTQTKNEDSDGLSAFSKDSLVSHIQTLSSDEFLGRKPFSEGETKTIAYLTEQFKVAGLEPGNGNSYLQDVPMVMI
ncbi:MAG: peptidase M28, partial [Bacteroidota bacterium]